MTNEQTIKWALEVCNQEKVQPAQLIKDYSIDVLGY